MDYLRWLLEDLSTAEGVSANEKQPKEVVKKELKKLGIPSREDNVGNLIALKKGVRNNIKVMVVSHIDEIGFVVTDFDENVLRFSTVGGFDKRILLGQEVVVHGKKRMQGVIGSIPPHFVSKEKQKKVLEVDDLFIDMGLSEKELRDNVNVGDFVSLNKDFVDLLDGKCSGKSVDNRAGVASLIYMFRELRATHHECDVYGVFSVQEEITGLGALSSSYKIRPDVGIAVDVGFAKQSGFPEDYPVELGKGPVIAIGPNIHPGMQNNLVKIAKEYEVSYQIEAEPRPTGTDAKDIQLSREGIPTLLVSIPIRYMHTPCEVVYIKDIVRTGTLLSLFARHINVEMFKGERYAT
jgi:putative aminopeptidase FrvX